MLVKRYSEGLNLNKAAFMGRNGTIHTMPKGGLINISTLRALDGSIPALNLLGQSGYILSIITNEKERTSDGLNYLAIVHQVENWIRGSVYNPIFFRYCYHHHAKKCDCRLPKAGLLDALKDQHDIDMAESIMFASCKHEVTAAEAAGIGTIVRLSTGKADWNGTELPIYDNLLEAVKEIL